MTRAAASALASALVISVIATSCTTDATAPTPGELGPVVNGVRTTGTTSLVVIPALFSGSSESPFTPADLQRRLFDGPSAVGTLTEYYREMSGNRFTLRGTVTPWVRTNVGSGESGAGIEGDSREVDHVIAAIRAVDASIDFGAYDNEGPDGKPNSGDDDGIVDGGVVVMMAEIGRNCGTAGVVWPHFASLEVVNTPDHQFRVADKTPAGTPLVVKAYVILSASTCNPNTLTGIAVASHELMHLLFQAPEMYSIGSLTESQPNGARIWRTGCWDVMSAGSGWGCGVGASQDWLTPVHANPWVKETLRWIRSDTIGTVADTQITLAAASVGGRTARFLIKPGEYFEIEYRQKVGYDSNIPASGVLIYHVTLDRPVTPPTCQLWCTQPPLLIEADDNNGLLRTMDQGGNRGEAGDAFGQLAHTTFGPTTIPAALADNGSPTTLRITEIVIDATARVARIRLSH